MDLMKRELNSTPPKKNQPTPSPSSTSQQQKQPQTDSTKRPSRLLLRSETERISDKGRQDEFGNDVPRDNPLLSPRYGSNRSRAQATFQQKNAQKNQTQNQSQSPNQQDNAFRKPGLTRSFTARPATTDHEDDKLTKVEDNNQDKSPPTTTLKSNNNNNNSIRENNNGLVKFPTTSSGSNLPKIPPLPLALDVVSNNPAITATIDKIFASGLSPFSVKDPSPLSSLVSLIEGDKSAYYSVLIDSLLEKSVTFLPNKKHAMWNKEEEDEDDDKPTTGVNDIVFFSMCFSGMITPEIVNELSEDQLYYYTSFLIQYEKKSKRSVMKALQNRLNQLPQLSQHIFFLQKVTNFWPSTGISAWRSSKILDNTVSWFDALGATSLPPVNNTNGSSTTANNQGVAAAAAVSASAGDLMKLEGKVWENLDILDPLGIVPDVVTTIKLEKIFPSNAKPFLLNFNPQPPQPQPQPQQQQQQQQQTSQPSLPSPRPSYLCLFKRGDDLRQDYAVQTMFFVLNRLWVQSHLQHKPFIHQYKVIPMGSNHGILEFVRGCTSSGEFSWKTLKSDPAKGVIGLTPEEKITFLTSMAGSYLACWVLGIRDRHQDNMLIKDGKIFFHIDFGFIFNDAPGFDAPIFSIPGGFRKNLTEDEWNFFLMLCGDAFVVLHQNSGLIINACTQIMGDLPSISVAQIRKYLVRSLMIGLSEKVAKHKIRQLIVEGSTSTQKEMKYFMHEIAVKMNK
eukprot:TRINITY_DN6027_c1_g2_i4.p1 TRINITY_DN6027_c1_g2~~TRINITY_DN6027_c1_g2_i4.p1  ORF type:complete len:732 (-),score=189.39 TRINITY_DN6027_c1_g2_i4:501-2696(-)